MIIKLLLIAGLVTAALVAYRSPISTRSTALRRLAGAGVLLMGVAAVLWPNVVSEVAQAVGVGRGTDLVLYALVVIFLLSWLGMYRRIHELEERLTTLARHLALQGAQAPGGAATEDS